MRKIASGVTTEYIYSVDGSVVAEKVGATWTKGYVYLGGQLLAQYSNSTTYFVHKDHLGSSRVLTRVDKSVHETYDYLPYGETTSTGTTTHKFTGKERDAESGLDFFGARFYASLSGRFMWSDPIQINSDRVLDPQRLNLYSYSRNNPLMYIDPTGRDIVQGTGPRQDDIFNALVKIASSPEGREMLQKLDDIDAEISISHVTQMGDIKDSNKQTTFEALRNTPKHRG